MPHHGLGRYVKATETLGPPAALTRSRRTARAPPSPGGAFFFETAFRKTRPGCTVAHKERPPSQFPRMVGGHKLTGRLCTLQRAARLRQSRNRRNVTPR